MTGLIAIVLASVLINAQEENRESYQDWFVLNESDPLTDLSRGIAATQDDSGAALVVKCDIMDGAPGDMYISYIADGYLGGTRSNRSRELIYRVDDETPVEVMASHDGSTASVLSRMGAQSIIEDLMDGDTVFFRARSFDYDTHDARFSLIGSSAAISRAYELCGKELPAG